MIFQQNCSFREIMRFKKIKLCQINKICREQTPRPRRCRNFNHRSYCYSSRKRHEQRYLRRSFAGHKGYDRKSQRELISLAQHNSSAMPLARSVLKRVLGSTAILLWYDLRLLGPAAELSASHGTNLWNSLT